MKGFSLVEFMVAMTIGSFLLIGLAQVFIGSRQSYRLHEGIGRVQENGRFAMEILGRQIRMAGYRSQPLSQSPVAAVAGANDVDSANNRLPGTDEITLRIYGASAGATADCLGNGIAAHEQVTMTFYVHKDRALYCRSQHPDKPPQVQPLLAGITDMQLLFGERINDRFRYLTSENVSNWNNVISVRIALTTDSIETVDHRLPNDGRLENTYTSTVSLRNRL